MRQLALPLLCLLTSHAFGLDGVPEAYHGFPRDQTLVPGRLYYRSDTGMGRITTVTYHNGAIFSENIAGSTDREWRFDDLTDPSSLRYVGRAPRICNAATALMATRSVTMASSRHR